MKFLNKLSILVIILVLLFSCSIIDLGKIDISVSVPIDGIIEENSSIFLEFSESISDSALPDKIKLKEFFTDSYTKLDTFWVDDSKIEVVFIEELEPGTRYILSLDGSTKSSLGVEYKVSLLHSFYYVNSEPPLMLISFNPENAQTIGNFESLELFFSAKPNQEDFTNEFSISPSKELNYEWSNEGKDVSITAEDGWDNYTSYSWRYNDNDGVFIVQQDTSPPQLLSIETGNYNNDDGTFTATGSDLNLVEYNTALRMNFSEAVNKESVSTAFSIEPAIDGILWQNSSDKWLFLPDEGWDQETEYTIKLSTDLYDLAGNYLKENYSAAFCPSIPPVEISSLTVVSTTGGSVNIADLNSKIPVSISVDLPDNSCNINLNFSSGEFTSFKERESFIDSINFDGYLPPTTAPALINYQWTSNTSLSLNYSGFVNSTGNSPWSNQTYKFSIPVDKGAMNNFGSYVKEEVEIVFTITP